jgi:hypothetical protein
MRNLCACVSHLSHSDTYHLRLLGYVAPKGTSRPLAIYEPFDGDTPDLLLQETATLDRFHTGLESFTSGRFADTRAAFEQILADSSGDNTAAWFPERTAQEVSREMAETIRDGSWDGVIYF